MSSWQVGAVRVLAVLMVAVCLHYLGGAALHGGLASGFVHVIVGAVLVFLTAFTVVVALAMTVALDFILQHVAAWAMGGSP